MLIEFWCWHTNGFLAMLSLFDSDDEKMGEIYFFEENVRSIRVQKSF